MTPSLRRRIQAAVVAGVFCCAGGAVAQQPEPQQASPTAAKATAKADAAKRKAAAKSEAGTGAKMDAAAAQGEVEAGINALGQGKPETAVTSLSNALAAGSLPTAQTARALYYRGVAYRRQAKPAQAISDLTNALWIKGGLTDEQRTDALLQRSGAYREAGLPDQAEPPSQRQVAAKPAAGSASFTAVAPAAPGAASSPANAVEGFFSSLFGGGSSQSAKPAPVTPPAASPAASLVATAPVVAKPAPVVVSRAAPVTTATIVPVVPEAAPGKPATRMVPVIVERAPLPVGFQDFPDQVREVEVSTTARAAQPQPAPGAGVATRSWEETKVKQTPAAAARAQAALPKVPPEQQTATVPARVAAAPTAAAVPAGTAMGQKGRAGGGPVAPVTGSVQIQVAAVRSAEEAQGVAAKLQSGFAAELAGRTPVIEQTVVGNLGMLYRVQVGPFASARDTESLCARLKGQGMDCRVVGQ